MDMQAISQLIGSVGFPIVVTCYLLWDSRQTRIEHKEEMDKISEALNNNTAALIKLTDHMENQSHVEQAVNAATSKRPSFMTITPEDELK